MAAFAPPYVETVDEVLGICLSQSLVVDRFAICFHQGVETAAREAKVFQRGNITFEDDAKKYGVWQLLKWHDGEVE